MLMTKVETSENGDLPLSVDGKSGAFFKNYAVKLKGILRWILGSMRQDSKTVRKKSGVDADLLSAFKTPKAGIFQNLSHFSDNIII